MPQELGVRDNSLGSMLQYELLRTRIEKQAGVAVEVEARWRDR